MNSHNNKQHCLYNSVISYRFFALVFFILKLTLFTCYFSPLSKSFRITGHSSFSLQRYIRLFATNMPKSKKSASSSSSSKTIKAALTREIEKQLQGEIPFVIGTDEAGRGPLAGPVVAAACFIPPHLPLIDGIKDSKLLSESDREIAYEQLIHHPEIVYGVAIVSHIEIDEVNILQASLLGMTRATQQLLDKLKEASSKFTQGNTASNRLESEKRPKGRKRKVKKEEEKEGEVERKAESSGAIAANEEVWKSNFIGMVDGNHLPLTYPLSAVKAVIQGDRKVYSIAAASIIAKVTRDRLMVEYDQTYPVYLFAKHKGYPTAEHRSLLVQHGPCEIHRKTYGPVKVILETMAKKHSQSTLEKEKDLPKRKPKRSRESEQPKSELLNGENSSEKVDNKRLKKRRRITTEESIVQETENIGTNAESAPRKIQEVTSTRRSIRISSKKLS